MPINLILQIKPNAIEVENWLALSRQLQLVHVQSDYNFAWPFQAGELENLHAMLDTTVTLPRNHQPLEEIYTFGERLRRAFLHTDPEFYAFYRAAYTQAQHQGGLRLLLVLDPALAAAPWEYMNETVTLPHASDVSPNSHHRRFMAMHERVSIVRVRQVRVGQTTPPVSGCLRILIVAIPAPEPWPAVDIAALIGQIREPLAEAIQSGIIAIDTITETRATLERVHERLQENPYQVVHFIGHGRYGDPRGAHDPGTEPAARRGMIMVYDQDGRYVPAESEQLSGLLVAPFHDGEGYDSPVRLVVLMNCASARTLTLQGFSDLASHLAQEIPAIMAMHAAIGHRAAQLFTSRLYGYLAAVMRYGGASIVAAMDSARRNLLTDSDTAVELGIPLLYLRTQDEVLFSGENRARPAASLVAGPAELVEVGLQKQAAGDYDSALRYFGDAIQMDLSRQEEQFLLAQILLCLARREQDYYSHSEATYRQILARHLRRLYQTRRWDDILVYGQDLQRLRSDDSEPGIEIQHLLMEAERFRREQQELARFFDQAMSQFRRHEWENLQRTCRELSQRDPEYRRIEREALEKAAAMTLEALEALHAQIRDLAAQQEWGPVFLIGEGILRREGPDYKHGETEQLLMAAHSHVSHQASLPGALDAALRQTLPDAWAYLSDLCSKVRDLDPDHPIAQVLHQICQRRRDEEQEIVHTAERIVILPEE